jgi:hypothetical protein
LLHSLADADWRTTYAVFVAIGEQVNVLSHAAANEQRMTYQRRANETARFTAEQMMDDQISAQEVSVHIHTCIQLHCMVLVYTLMRSIVKR